MTTHELIETLIRNIELVKSNYSPSDAERLTSIALATTALIQLGYDFDEGHKGSTGGR